MTALNETLQGIPVNVSKHPANEPIRIISISDIHLGHRLVPTEHIIRNLNRMLPDSAIMRDISIIFLCGDVFDESLALSDTNVALIQLWMVRLLKLCRKWDICLRVLEGTPSHDRRQSKQFDILNNSLDIGTDLKYIDTLSIEHIARYDINVLYMPDEWRGETEQTKVEVKELLSSHGLDQVDYGVFHGMFAHQLPNMKHMPIHDTEYYLSIVKKYIFIGHIHVMSQHERILAQGSPDRLSHNEEHAKGFFFVEAYPNSFDNDRIVFRINHHAARFITVNTVGLDRLDTEVLLENTMAQAEEENEDYEIPVHIRVVHEKNDSNEDIVNSYRKSYVRMKWTAKPVGIKSEVASGAAPSVYVPVPINENTIVPLMKNRLTTYGVEERLLTKSLDILNNMKGV